MREYHVRNCEGLRVPGLLGIRYGWIRMPMSGSTSSGHGPNCEIDVMGHKRPPSPFRVQTIGVVFSENFQWHEGGDREH
jgi:hypothetical protein